MHLALIVGLVAGLLGAAPTAARADAYETSLHMQALGGFAKLGDPLVGDAASRVSMAGGAARFTWATRDWLAWEIEAHGMAATVASYEDVEMGGRGRDFKRGATVLGVDAGLSLRRGARFIPSLSLAIGPQLRLYPAAAARDTGTSVVSGEAASQSVVDLTLRASLGLDYRATRRLVVGVRASGRTTVGIGAGAWRSIEGLVHASYYWYPRWWSL